MATDNKDFKVKHGLSVNGGATFGNSIAIGEPTLSTHAATKQYVDDTFSNLDGYFNFPPVEAATTDNVNLTTGLVPGATLDGVPLSINSRVLVKNQIDETENGVYIVNGVGAASRAPDFLTNSQLFTGAQIYVASGSTNASTAWVLVSTVIDVDAEPLIFEFFGPQQNIDTDSFATAYTDVEAVKSLGADILRSSLNRVGTLDNLTVAGETIIEGSLVAEGISEFLTTTSFRGNLETDAESIITLNGQLTINSPTTVAASATFSEPVTFSDTVSVQTPTQPLHAVTKDYVDNLLNQEQVEITTIDDLSNYFNGFESRFKPTYQGIPVTLQNPFNLLLTIDGIIQSVGYPDYVWQSVMPRVGFRIDNDGYIAFPEPIPPGSSFDARVLVGSDVTKQTKIYPFKAMDIVLGGY